VVWHGVDRDGPVPRSGTLRHGGLPGRVRRALATAGLCGLVLVQLVALPAPVVASGAHASTAQTSRWWTLTCAEGGGTRTAAPACAFTVKLRGVLDGSRLHLVHQALRRRATVRRALHRDVTFQVDVDSPGGELFAALETGRLLRAEGATLTVGPQEPASARVSSS
jgi:hypothetical protein